MTAYIVAMRRKITDPAEMAIYSQKARAVDPGRQTILALGGKCETLEGDPPVENAVLISFPTYEEAKAWYDSPEYADARQHRLKGGDYQLLLFEGRDA